MTEDFAAYLQARLEELTGGERFHRKSGGTAAPQVVRTQLPWRDADYIEGEDLPLVCWCLTGGEVAAQTITLEALVTCAVWTPGTVRDGSADIERLMRAVLGLAGDRAFSGFRLADMRFTFGEENDILEPIPAPQGSQPHPYHKGKVHLTFTAPGPSRRKCHS